MVIKRLASLAVVLALGTSAVAQAPSVRLDGELFRVVGWTPPALPPSAGWSSILVIYAGRGDIPALLGRYSIEGGQLVFRPSYPIAAGVQYRAVFRPPGGTPIETTIAGPLLNRTPVARVDQVYPSADEWPSNTLRLYVVFSAPMSRGEASARLRILSAGGQPLEGVFLPGEELWDPTHQRLTLTFDPGRIKRGLVSNAAMGTPIADRATYTLVIDREWPDARGVPMVAEFRKTFRGGPAVRAVPDAKTWRVSAPAAGTSQPLTLTFPQAMNVSLLPRTIQVLRDRERVAGVVTTGRHETEWRFTPRAPWTAGAYRVEVDTRLEDVAGNRPGLPFDFEAGNVAAEHRASPPVSIPVQIR